MKRKISWAMHPRDSIQILKISGRPRTPQQYYIVLILSVQRTTQHYLENPYPIPPSNQSGAGKPHEVKGSATRWMPGEHIPKCNPDTSSTTHKMEFELTQQLIQDDGVLHTGTGTLNPKPSKQQSGARQVCRMAEIPCKR
jgi:hypothetical protein